MADRDENGILRRRTAGAAAVGLICVHNVVQNTILNERGYVTGNALVAAALIWLGKASGLRLTEMGMRPVIDASGLRLVAATGATVTGSAFAAVAFPATRAVFFDERARDTSRETVLMNSLVRFPIGTALFEEVAFRGVLPQLVARSERTGDLLSSALFGLWHVIPTARVLPGNPLRSHVSSSALAVAAGSVATAIAGFALTSVRRRSGSVAVPWLLHSIFNIVTYLAGVVAWRSSGGRCGPFTRRPR